MFFMSSVKESDQLKHGGKVVSAMQKKDHTQLWQGLHNGKEREIWWWERFFRNIKTYQNLYDRQKISNLNREI
jgi:hypothetical protein